MQSQQDLFASLFGSRSQCVQKKCICKPGYFRESSDPDAPCVSFDKCFGGCPQHARFNPKTPYCVGYCADPEADKCREMTENLPNWLDHADKLTLPGCECMPGYTRKTDHPWSECVPDKKCTRPTPNCTEMGKRLSNSQ